MSTPNVIKIDDIEYVRADEAKKTEGDIKIVVVDRGFIYVGNLKIEADFVVLTNAKNIRYWGTANGLGELINGPTKTTKLDATGTVRVPLRAVISIIDVVQNKWNSL